MIEVIFDRTGRTLSWPVPGGTRTIEAFSEVRNELNGERPDPSRLPDIEYGINKNRTVGKIVMPRPFPAGTWAIYKIEPSTERWTSPAKILTQANQLVPVWSLKADGTYDGPTGENFSDWCYWIHYANGSHHTDGCIGVVDYHDFGEFLESVRAALDSGIPISVTAQ